MKIVICLMTASALGGLSAYQLCGSVPRDEILRPSDTMPEITEIRPSKESPSAEKALIEAQLFAPLRTPGRSKIRRLTASRAVMRPPFRDLVLDAQLSNLNPVPGQESYEGIATIVNRDRSLTWRRTVQANARTGLVHVLSNQAAIPAAEWLRTLRFSPGHNTSTAPDQWGDLTRLKRVR